jgi:hypothetical protein
MSALYLKWTCRIVIAMSALPPKAIQQNESI